MSEYICVEVVHKDAYATEDGDSWDVVDYEPVEKVVRCRDCKHVKHDPEWQPDRRFKPVDMWTCHAEWCEGFEGDHPRVEPDGFCKWGEKEER